jgi:ABC-2 type transport system permease protein
LIHSELLRIRYSTAARVTGVVALVVLVGQALLLALLPVVIDGLVALNEVVPNATEADQMSGADLAAFSLESASVQMAVADLTGSTAGGIAGAAVLVCVFAGLMIANEFRRGSIIATMLSFPRRYDAVSGKVVAITIVVLASGAVLAAVRLGILLLGAQLQDVPIELSAATVAATWGRGALALVLLALAAVGLALLLRTPAATLSVVVIVAVIEASARPIMSLLVDGWNPTRALPFGLVSEAVASPQLASIGPASAAPDPVLALFVLAGWAVVLLGAGCLRTLRSDVFTPQQA